MALTLMPTVPFTLAHNEKRNLTLLFMFVTKMALAKMAEKQNQILEELAQQRLLLEELLVPVRKAVQDKLALIEFEKNEKIVQTCCKNLDNVRLLRATFFYKRKHLDAVGTEEARDDLRKYVLDATEELEAMKGCHSNYIDLFCYPEDAEIKCDIHG